MEWESYADGSTLGQAGIEGGDILKDEVIDGSARITLEKGGFAPFTITCGIYGMMCHTVFAAEETEAMEKYEGMKFDLKEFLSTPEMDVEWLEGFVEKW